MSTPNVRETDVWNSKLSPNDEVERRGASPASNEGTLSQSSIHSLAHRRRDPRSLEPIVSFLCATPILRAEFRAPVSQ
jgi:hypothetical protein